MELHYKSMQFLGKILRILGGHFSWQNLIYIFNVKFITNRSLRALNWLAVWPHWYYSNPNIFCHWGVCTDTEYCYCLKCPLYSDECKAEIGNLLRSWILQVAYTPSPLLAYADACMPGACPSFFSVYHKVPYKHMLFILKYIYIIKMRIAIVKKIKLQQK